MNFAGNWKEIENVILSEVTQIQKDIDMVCTHLVSINHNVQVNHTIIKKPQTAK